VVIVTLPLFVGSAGFIRIVRLKRERRLLQQEILILKAEREVLNQRVKMYIKSKELIERKARDELGMIKQGEKVFQIESSIKP